MKNLQYKTKFIILLFVLLCISCSKKNKIESIFIANKNEYWEYENYCLNIKNIYFQYNKDGSSNKYIMYTDEGFSLFDNDGDLQNGPRPWSIKNDSTLVYDFLEYKIEKIDNKGILLSYYNNKVKNKKCFVKLSKWVDGPDGPKPLDPHTKIEK